MARWLSALLVLTAVGCSGSDATGGPVDASIDAPVDASIDTLADGTDSAVSDTGADSTRVDSGSDGADASSDSRPTDASGDAGSCSKGDPSACGGGLACLCCPAGGPLERCTCTTACTVDADCKDPARPVCNHSPGEKGICVDAAFVCCWLCK